MGLIDQYIPSIYKRTETVISKGGVPAASSSIQTTGGTFVLLTAQLTNGTVPTRLRLYSDENSMNADVNRATNNFSTPDSIALIADVVLQNANKLVLNPPIIGNTFSGGQVWYHLSSSATVTDVVIETYAMADQGDSNKNKTFITVSGSQVPITGNGVSGSFVTPKSYIILRGESYYNLNPDPSWALGTSNDGNGWEFLQSTTPVGNIRNVDSTVTKDFPNAPVGAAQVAAKISTRTGTFWKDGGFYYVPLETGKTYKLSAWVWGSGSLQNFSNIDAATVGVIGTMADSGGNPIGYQSATVLANVPEWQEAEVTFTVGAGTSSMLIGTFMDVPYPAGYGFNAPAPVCDSAYNLDPLACPGYAWYTDFKVENITDFGSRVRLYSTDVNEIPSEEKTRAFGTLPPVDSKLIADMMFDSSSFNYPLVPVLEAHTWQDGQYAEGLNRTGYILENRSTSATVPLGSLDAIFNIYSLED